MTFLISYLKEEKDERFDNIMELGLIVPKEEALSVETYLAYKQGETKFEDEAINCDAYEKFDALLVEKNGTAVYDGIIAVANEILLDEDTASFEHALAAIIETVDDVTSILRVLIYPVLVLGGAANMFITVNTLPLVLEIGGVEKVGTFTGYYYTATFSAQIASPIVYGFIRMFAGTYMSLFYYSPIMFLLAIILIMFVKHGEAVPQEIIDKIEEEND